MRLTIATTGRYEPKCFDFEGQEDSSRPFVEYRLMTGEQVEMVRSQSQADSWARIWKSQVTRLGNTVFEVDGMEKEVAAKDVPGIPGTFVLYFEVAEHILRESILATDDKKKLRSPTVS
ncbi:hypothetical protein [Sphaerochaeta sp. PS]|uniref:hypothetical protein n=1 Tax=Sphaerochaeta sp. PS TaxID=3076336 RepID=UPI0028A50CDE|nr:hypothetical protein [Sphaerochaeta sp. PS]MDT4761819.1 hypothetical protein [Sphaerochaeta sp. PS]